LRRVPRLIGSRIWLTAASMEEAGVAPSTHDVLIPHGNYLPWIAETRPGVVTTSKPSGSVRLLSFGALRPYKNVEETIAAVAASDGFSLLAAGGGRDEGYIAELISLAGGADNVEVRHGQVPDEELIDLILEADAVVASYKDFYNSGVAFLALSLDRPVIVPDGPMTRELREEFGAAWIGLYDPPLTPDGLRQAWDAVASHPPAVVWSPERAWPNVSRAHADLYRRVAGR
jgi:beta-1,4-mannosyltransferase